MSVVCGDDGYGSPVFQISLVDTFLVREQVPAGDMVSQ